MYSNVSVGCLWCFQHPGYYHYAAIFWCSRLGHEVLCAVVSKLRRVFAEKSQSEICVRNAVISLPDRSTID
jgi:hypothetical protein